MKQNYKTKYFLKQVLDLAYCAKQSNQTTIFLKTKNLTIPFSLYQIREMAKDCEALSLAKEGGDYDNENKRFNANQFYYDFDLLKQLYNDNKCDLRNLRKEAESKHIKVIKEKKTLNEPDIYSKYRCNYNIKSIKDVIDYIETERYPSVFNVMKESNMICNILLDEPRKMSYNIKVSLNKNNNLQKIGVRCTNSLVSISTKTKEEAAENFKGQFKEDVLKKYSLSKEYDVSSSIPRLTAVFNERNKWNDVKDYYENILKVCMYLIDCKVNNVKYNIDLLWKEYTIVSNNDKSDYKLFNDISQYFIEHPNKKENIFRENIKPMILPSYFDISAKSFSAHMNRRKPKYKKDGTLAEDNVMKAVEFWRSFCSTFNIDFRYFCEMLYIALRVVCGKTLDSKIFLIESAAYSLALSTLVTEYNLRNFLQIYDAVYYDINIKEEDIDKVFKESVYKVIELYKQDIDCYNKHKDCIEYTIVSNNNKSDYKLSAKGKMNIIESNALKQKKSRNLEIVELHNKGMKNKEISKIMKINVSRVSQILKKYKDCL